MNFSRRFSMKKWLLLVMAFCYFLFGGFNTANADYQEHLNGDPNFILIATFRGTGYYLDKSSLVVQQYAPPQYIIAVNVVDVPHAYDGDTIISRVQTDKFLYNWNTKSMYLYSDSKNTWNYINPYGYKIDKYMIEIPAGEMAFYLAYNMKFYKSSSYFNSDLYKRI